MYLIFDTETTGLPTKGYNQPISDVENWPRVVQLAWQLHDDDGTLIEHKDFLIQPEGFDIPYGSEKIHGISTELASQNGITLSEGLELFNEVASKATFLVGHNVKFDVNVLGCEFFRSDLSMATAAAALRRSSRSGRRTSPRCSARAPIAAFRSRAPRWRARRSACQATPGST